ncbi:NR2CA protein, partial [Crypturellus soui]|nr:NR2CA protein [Crypturellus soui]
VPLSPCPGVARRPRRVSSVLNRDVKQFGKTHMFDANEETCWNSDQGPVQWVSLDFPRTVKVSRLHVQFQGGFSSRRCTLQGCRTGEELAKISELYPEDSNALQISFGTGRLARGARAACLGCAGTDPAPRLEVPSGCPSVPVLARSLLDALHSFQVPATVLDRLRITFENGTDFFGRIVVYHLRVLGERL